MNAEYEVADMHSSMYLAQRTSGRKGGGKESISLAEMLHDG